MKVKTFTIGLANGLEQAFQVLDDKVNAMGDITIHGVTDQLMPERGSANIVRVVVYTPGKQKHFTPGRIRPGTPQS